MPPPARQDCHDIAAPGMKNPPLGRVGFGLVAGIMRLACPHDFKSLTVKVLRFDRAGAGSKLPVQELRLDFPQRSAVQDSLG